MRNEEHFLRRVNPHRLYRSKNRVVAGVIGGLARYYGWNVAISRVIAVVLTLSLFPIPALVYLVAMFMIPKEPEQQVYSDAQDEEFWRTTTLKPQHSFGEVRHRMRELEQRLREMEAFVTSPRYELDRELGRHARHPN